jgi:hypothetical protein
MVFTKVQTTDHTYLRRGGSILQESTAYSACGDGDGRTRGCAQESNFDRPPSRYSSCKILVILFFYIGTSIYSISEVFIGRSLIVSRYLLANLKGIRLAVPTLKTHLSTFTSLILHISWKKVQIVP